MQEFQVEIEDIEEALGGEDLTSKDRSDFTKKLKKLKEKKAKYDLRYTEILK